MGYLTDGDCSAIVYASLDPGRVFGGPDGHNGGPPDVLLVEVESIVRRHRVEALREAADNMPINRPGQPYEHAAGWLRARADRIEEREL